MRVLPVHDSGGIVPVGSFSLRDAILSFLFPPVCFCCASLLSSSTRLLCPPCQSRILPLLPDDPLFCSTYHRLCDDGLCADLVSAYHFEKEGPVQALVHAMKYRGGVAVGSHLGVCVGQLILRRAWAASIDLIVPLPLHRARFRERGYNQAELFARGIAGVLDVPVVRSGLRRARWTDSQTKLGYAERQANVAFAFELLPKKKSPLQGKNILLVDDVITTGATIRACAAALSSGTGSTVYVASIALAEQNP